MQNSTQVVCSCGQKLPQPVPRICPRCKAEITVIRKNASGFWLNAFLISLMFGVLLGLILFLSNYMSK